MIKSHDLYLSMSCINGDIILKGNVTANILNMLFSHNSDHHL